MNKLVCFLLLACFLNLAIYPAFADEEYMVLPPLMQDTSYPVKQQTYTSAPLRGNVTTIPVGTAFQVIMNDDINSKRTQVGEIFTATLNAPIQMGGEIIVPAGSTVTGQVTYMVPAARAGKNAKMEMKFTSIKPLYGAKVPMIGKVLTQDNTGIVKGGTLKEQLVKHVKTEAVATAGGTIVGAGVGGILGGVTAGTGAAVGAISGAGVGLAYILWRKGREVKIPAGTKMVIMLEQPFSIGK